MSGRARSFAPTRRRSSVFAIALLAIVAVAAGCGRYGDLRDSSARPLNATVSTPEEKTVVRPGSFCWGGLCVDGVLDAASTPVLVVGANQPMETENRCVAWRAHRHSVGTHARNAASPT